MKKSLIALAVAGAFAVPSAAMAVDVSFGGEFDLAVEQFDNGVESQSQMNNTHSRFWWDMVDDLGTGLMVKGHLELDVGAVGYHGGGAVNQPDGSGGINNRNSYVGLAGESWGEVRFGTQENIHEATGYAVDPFHGAAGPGGNIVNGLGQPGINPLGSGQNLNAVFNGTNIGARRTDSTITYISPNWGGFSLQVDYSLEGSNSTGLSTAPNTDAWNELFYGARYDGQTSFGGWRVYGAGADITGAQFSDIDLTPVGGIANEFIQMDMSGYRLGGGMTFGNFAIDAIFETNEWKVTTGASAGAAGTKIERDGIWVGGSWMIPTGKLALGYIMMDDADVNGASINGSDTTNLSVGYYHTLSANSNLYVIYNTMDNGENAQSNIQNGVTTEAGKDPSAISLGMYLVF
jgi:predicted porin